MEKITDTIKQEATCFNVRIAGLNAEIRTIYKSSYFYCRDFLSDGLPLFTVQVTEEDIHRAMEKRDKYFYMYRAFEGVEDKYFLTKEKNESDIEISVLYAKFVEVALEYNRIFMHGAVVGINDKSVMFTAPTGTGKTTHIMKWIENVKDAYVVNGDKPLIHINNDEVLACGTPWRGKENLGINTMVPLKAIIVMERNELNRIEEISFEQAYPFLLQQTYIPNEVDKAKKTLELLIKLSNKVRIYRFMFNNLREDCFETAYNTLIGNLT